MADDWTVERQLRDKPEQVVDLYCRFIGFPQSRGAVVVEKRAASPRLFRFGR